MAEITIDEMRQFLIRTKAEGWTMDHLLAMSDAEIRSIYNRITYEKEEPYVYAC